MVVVYSLNGEVGTLERIERTGRDRVYWVRFPTTRLLGFRDFELVPA